MVECPLCRGVGWIEFMTDEGQEEATCFYCNGEGQVHQQHDTRPRTEAADATRTHETVDTEGDQETTGTHTDNNNNKRETTTTTTKETKENSSTV